MKKFVYLFVIVLFCALQGNAQALRSSTLLETSPYAFSLDFTSSNYLDRTNIDQTIYWRRRYNAENREKTVYAFHSLYKRDSVIGVRIYGIDIDMMAETFEKTSGNTFRYWNKLRLGFTLIMEKNPKSPPFALQEWWYYLDGEVYVSYLHLPRSARGDKTTRFRRGSFMAFVLVTPFWRIDTYIKVNLGGVWLKPYYYQEYAIPRLGFCVEWEINKNGYDKSKYHSSKDLYRGITLIGGSEYNMKTSQISLRLGMKIDLRNH